MPKTTSALGATDRRAGAAADEVRTIDGDAEREQLEQHEVPSADAPDGELYDERRDDEADGGTTPLEQLGGGKPAAERDPDWNPADHTVDEVNERLAQLRDDDDPATADQRRAEHDRIAESERRDRQRVGILSQLPD